MALVFPDPGPKLIDPGVYEHFKGGRFRLLMLAREEGTGTRVVVYTHLDETGHVWTRSVKSWVEQVEWPDGVERPRFRHVDVDRNHLE